MGRRADPPFPTSEQSTTARALGRRRRGQPDPKTLAAVLARVSDAVLTTDRDLNVEYLNHAAERLFEVRLEDVAGRPALEAFVHPAARAEARGWARRVIAGVSLSARVAKLCRADGSVFDGELSLFPVPDPLGARVRAGFVVRDVTARLAAERRAATLHSVVNAAAEGIVGVDEHGDIAFFSPAAERIYGWQEAEVVGRPATILAPANQRGDVAAIGDELRAGHAVRGETCALRKDGSQLEVHLTASPIAGPRGRYAGATLMVDDLSLRRRAEREARRSRELLQRIIDHAPNVIVFKDVDGRCVLINERGSRELHGLAPADVIGRRDEELFEARIAEELRAQDRAVIEAGAPLTFQHELPTAGGELRSYLTTRFPLPGAAGEPNGVGAIKVDVTEIRRARDTALQLATLVQSAPDAILTVDPNGLIATWNPSATAVFGLAAEQAVGRSYEQTLVPPADREASRARDVALGHTMRFRAPRLRADGSVFPAQLSVAPLTAADGAPAGLLAIVRDITDLVDAERALRERAEQLERSNVDLERFAYAASHDLQEPLLSMKLAAAAVASAAAERLDDDERALLAQLDEDAARLSAQIRGLMDSARVTLGALQAEPVPLDTAVRDALEALRAGAEAADARIEVRRPLPSASVPRPVVSLVMQNLIANAIRYRRPGVPPRITISGECSDNHVEVAVEDNGIGLAEADRERIFGVFARAQTGVPGTGMGLAIVRRMLERHGGTIAAESPGPGRGSRFIVRLPA
ncbi:MAG TPA: PAS domain S-box protein [Solirubrobacteraceae bacterium]|jgi:PAS domain S-box-containing protein